MKKTFKYIFATIALSSAALLSGVDLRGQNLPEGVYLEAYKDGKPAGIAYRKSSTLKPGSTDTYTVKLEAFVTGEVTMENRSIPADIVLVLDVSGSMDEHMYKYTYTARGSQAYSYDSYGYTYYYKHTDGKYYEVERERPREWVGYDYSRRYRLYYEVGNTTYYLSGTGVTTTAPTNVTSSSTTIWTGVLYSRSEEDLGTKMANLKTAVKAFIDTIQENDLYEKDEEGHLIRRKDENNNEISLGNQISIVKFAKPQYYNHNTGQTSTGASSNSAPIIEGNDRDNGTYRYNYTQVVKGFTKTDVAANVTALKDAVDGFVASGATAADYGMNLARLLIKDLVTREPNRESSKTVVFFTDGEPTHGNTFDNTVANAAIENSYQIKNNTTDNPFEATIFSVGVFSNETTNINTFMRRVSSNYLAARNMTGNVTEVSTKYYMNASNADLTAVFTTIAESSGGSGAQIGAGSVVTVDVVASSFALPEGVDEDDITVTVAPCTGQAEEPGDPEVIGGQRVRKLHLQFGAPKPAMGKNYTGDNGYPLPVITPDVGTDDDGQDMVTTTGFNFSENWCGKDEEHSEWHGYKQIISFEVKVNDTAVGGPNVATNDAKSGIYVDGEPLIRFNRPTVKIPVSIWIAKYGLTEEDSAVFNIQYAEYQEGVDPRDLPQYKKDPKTGEDMVDPVTGEKIETWQSFTKVIVNVNDPVFTDEYGRQGHLVKLVGLDPDYFYRIKEDAWAWTYEYTTERQYTYGDDQKNPFIFINDPKETVKEHEATVRNIFGTNYQVIDPLKSSSSGSGSGSGE